MSQFAPFSVSAFQKVFCFLLSALCFSQAGGQCRLALRLCRLFNFSCQLFRVSVFEKGWPVQNRDWRVYNLRLAGAGCRWRVQQADRCVYRSAWCVQKPELRVQNLTCFCRIPLLGADSDLHLAESRFARREADWSMLEDPKADTAESITPSRRTRASISSSVCR